MVSEVRKGKFEVIVKSAIHLYGGVVIHVRGCAGHENIQLFDRMGRREAASAYLPEMILLGAVLF